MSFIPEFEHDIFISYAHIDNEPLTEGQKGWIDRFHDVLQARVRQLLGAEPTFFLDDLELQGNDYFEDVLPAKLRKTALLVTIVSPRYANSPWCLKEVQSFCQAAEASGGIRIGNKARIFKVLKLPVPLEKHPSVLQGLLGYQFYEQDAKTGAPRELGSEFGAQVNFTQKVNDLAYEIQQLLETFRPGTENSAKAVSPDSGIKVYLAETTSDLTEKRDNIRRELQQRGHTVLPDRDLPMVGPDLQSVIRQQLAQARLSIHLVGARYGIVPEGEQSSVVALQNMLAAERSGPAFSRIIWIPPDVSVSDDRQRAFIEHLMNDSHAQRGAEVMQTSLEELKTTIDDLLDRAREAPQPALPEPTRTSGPTRVYLMCDGIDRDAIHPIEDHLFDQGCDVILPAMDGDEAQIRRDHVESLAMCDAALIYAGSASDVWLRAQQRELLKAPGYGRTEPMRAKAIYLGPPGSPTKQSFRSHDATVIKHFAPFAPDVLTSFVAQLGGAKEAGS
jgi:hypothetical protein